MINKYLFVQFILVMLLAIMGAYTGMLVLASVPYLARAVCQMIGC